MLPVGQEALCERCGLDSWNREGFRAADTSLKQRPDWQGRSRCGTWPLPRQPVWALMGIHAYSAAFKNNTYTVILHTLLYDSYNNSYVQHRSLNNDESVVYVTLRRKKQTEPPNWDIKQKLKLSTLWKVCFLIVYSTFSTSICTHLYTSSCTSNQKRDSSDAVSNLPLPFILIIYSNNVQYVRRCGGEILILKDRVTSFCSLCFDLCSLHNHFLQLLCALHL